MKGEKITGSPFSKIKNEPPSGDWVGGNKISVDGKDNKLEIIRGNKLSIKIDGAAGGVLIVLIAGLGGYLYCEKATGHEFCDIMREKLSLKKN